MNRHYRLAVLASALFAASVAHADSVAKNDYPTAERVLFVDECAADYPDRPRFELVQKCSCVVDRLARQYSYDDYVDLTTAAKAFSIAGERGNVVRDTPMGQRLNTTWKKALAEAKEACFLK